jgi:hypothetical protein
VIKSAGGAFVHFLRKAWFTLLLVVGLATFIGHVQKAPPWLYAFAAILAAAQACVAFESNYREPTMAETSDGPFRLTPVRLWAGWLFLVVVVGLLWLTSAVRAYWNAEHTRAALERVTPPILPGMTVKEVGYIKSARTSYDFEEERYYTWFQFRVPLTGDSWVCSWQSGNRILIPDESVYFFHAEDVSDEGSRDAVLQPILGKNQPATACSIFTEDEAIELSAP